MEDDAGDLVERDRGEPAPSSRRPAWLWPAAAWLVGTALAVTFSVLAINLAGAGVSDRSSLALSPARVADALSLSAPSGHRRATSRASAPKAPATSAAGPVDLPHEAISTTSLVPVGSSGHDQPGAGSRSTSGDGAEGTTTTAVTAPASTSTTATPSSTKAVSSQGGTATFQCIGSTLSLLSAAPANGYETDKKTAAQVVFVRDTPPHTSQITASCSAGTVTSRVRELSDD